MARKKGQTKVRPKTPARVTKKKRARRARGHQHPELVGLALVALGAFLAVVLWLGWDGGVAGGRVAGGLDALLGTARVGLPALLLVLGGLMIARAALVDVSPFRTGIAVTTLGAMLLLGDANGGYVGGALEALVKVARDRPRAGAIGALVRNRDGTLQPSARKVPGLGESLGHAFLGPFLPDNRFTRSYTMAGWDRRSEREVEWVSGSAMLLRREALDDVGSFDEGYFMYVEDVDLCTRLRRRGWTVLFSPELEVIHQIGVSTRGQRGRMAFEHSRSIDRYYRKFHGRGAGAVLAPFVRAALWLRAVLVSTLAGRRRR